MFVWSLLLSLASPQARGQVHEWSQQLGGLGLDLITAMVRDSVDQPVVGGRYSDQVNLGGGAFVATGDHDNFLAKYSAGDTHQWSLNIVGTALNRIRALAVGPMDDIVLVGDGSDTINLGGADLALGIDGAYAARYDSAGNHLWSRVVGNNQGAAAYDVDFDEGGDIFVTGSGLFNQSSLIKLDP